MSTISDDVIIFCLAFVAAAALMVGRARAQTASLEVELKLTDQDYQPISDEPIRLVFGVGDWQAPGAGIRVVTDADGMARFITEAVVSRRWSSSNIGFTPFSMPFRGDHIAIGAELAFVMPTREGGEITHHWLYTADIRRLPDGDCSSDDLDRVYEAGPDGRFTRLVGTNAAGPNFDALVDGWKLTGAGYKLWDFMLDPAPDTANGKAWHLKLGLMRKPKPVLPK
jgi:hypothetical protein